jgi:hypothetical protein
MSDEYERDYWQEYKDDRAEGYINEDGSPREPEEPEPEPPLDLDAVAGLLRAATHADPIPDYFGYFDPKRPDEVITEDARRLLVEHVAPHMLTELSDFRAAEESWAELPTRTEWAMTASRDEPPGPETRWHTSAEHAEMQHGKGGQLWVRTLTIGAAIAVSDEPPF